MEVRPFEILFDRGEDAPLEHPSTRIYDKLGFPNPPAGRPWVYSNFVQSLDGIVSLLGRNFSGADIAQSAEDRWLMDLLRVHADAILTGVTTMLDERDARSPESRGIVFRIADPELQKLRETLGRGRERNFIVSGSGRIPWHGLKLFDEDSPVEAGIVTTETGERSLGKLPTHIHLIVAGSGPLVDWNAALRKLRDDAGIRYLLCEGGPGLYGSLARADLIDEKFITVSPVETGQLVPDAQERLPRESGKLLLRPTIFGGPGFVKEEMTWWEWISCRRVGNHQFSRYRRRRA